MRIPDQNGNINISTGRNQDYSKNKSENTKLNTVFNQENNYNEIIKSLKEQIEAVNKNDSYSDDVKKVKVDQLQKRIDEIEKQKAIQMQAVLQQKEAESKKPKGKNKPYTDINEDGDTYLSQEDAKALIEADISKEKLYMYSQSKARIGAEAHRLEDEINKDAGRGFGILKMDFREGLLGKLKEAITGLVEAVNKEMGKVNKNAEEVSEKKLEELNAPEIKEDAEDVEGETGKEPKEGSAEADILAIKLTDEEA